MIALVIGLLVACAPLHTPKNQGLHAITGVPPPAPVEAVSRDELARLLHAPSERPRVVAFFATWCQPCAEELPMLQRLAREGVTEVTLVSLDLPGHDERVAWWLRSLGVDLPAVQLVDPDLREATSALLPGWPRVLPATVILGGRGELRWTAWGRVDEAALRAALR